GRTPARPARGSRAPRLAPAGSVGQGGTYLEILPNQVPIGSTRSIGLAGVSRTKCQQARLMSTESTCQVVRETRVPVSVLDWWNVSRGDDARRAGGFWARWATHALMRGNTPVGPRLAEGAIRPSDSNIGRGPVEVKYHSTNAVS